MFLMEDVGGNILLKDRLTRIKKKKKECYLKWALPKEPVSLTFLQVGISSAEVFIITVVLRSCAGPCLCLCQSWPNTVWAGFQVQLTFPNQ